MNWVDVSTTRYYECCRKSACIAENVQVLQEIRRVLQKICRCCPRCGNPVKTGNKQFIETSLRYKSHSNENNEKGHERHGLELFFCSENKSLICSSARAQGRLRETPLFRVFRRAHNQGQASAWAQGQRRCPSLGFFKRAQSSLTLHF